MFEGECSPFVESRGLYVTFTPSCVLYQWYTFSSCCKMIVLAYLSSFLLLILQQKKTIRNKTKQMRNESSYNNNNSKNDDNKYSNQKERKKKDKEIMLKMKKTKFKTIHICHSVPHFLAVTSLTSSMTLCY